MIQEVTMFRQLDDKRNERRISVFSSSEGVEYEGMANVVASINGQQTQQMLVFPIDAQSVDEAFEIFDASAKLKIESINKEQQKPQIATAMQMPKIQV